MAAAVGIVRRIGLFHSPIGQLVGGMGEDGVPPIEEFVGIACAADGVIASSGARRDFGLSAP